MGRHFKNAIIVAALVAATVQVAIGQEAGDRPGSDYRNFDVADWGQCQAACQADSNCKAWTFVRPGIHGPSARCWLKSSVPPFRPDACCVSGVKTGASTDTTCDAYARTAVEQTQQARQFACPGIRGARWDATYQDHYGWCLTVPQSARDAETQGRAQTLAACAVPGIDPACDAYAQTAVEQTMAARTARCGGISGARWDATYQDHYGWCRRVSQAERDRETQQRQNTLVSCGATTGPAGLCADPRVQAIMDEWLRVAIPPQQSGESLYYDQWGRVLGQAQTGIIRPAGNPDAPLGRCVWLLSLAHGLHSMNGYGTLQGYLESRLR